ncbi:hypothetical protein ANCCAN_26893 [Ancylostoma caninum]|uniref:Knottin scorpion toxin-like domain-containing protein n=1 Tax=Ancylostoma caninum TaxID=29170 RepID=A0A368F5M7_ANCCA|nr:hypothetical protein ANCCAN_26893 [Ancylostoma caninum]
MRPPKPQASRRGYCNVLDHQACDELCKVDNYWYGHCTAWDGKNFSCKCFDYVAPLDGTVCTGKHTHCARKCKETVGYRHNHFMSFRIGQIL